MFIRHPKRAVLAKRAVLGSLLAIALSIPGFASAQGLFGTPTADPNTPPADTAAAPAAPAPKPIAKKKPRKPAVPKQASRVNVANKRAATLVQLSLVSQSAKNAKPQIVAHDLPSGNKVVAPLAKNGGCIYSVSGAFDDQSTIELSAVDLCKDNNLNLIE